jgi:hypothetical protein
VVFELWGGCICCFELILWLMLLMLGEDRDDSWKLVVRSGSGAGIARLRVLPLIGHKLPQQRRACGLRAPWP